MKSLVRLLSLAVFSLMFVSFAFANKSPEELMANAEQNIAEQTANAGQNMQENPFPNASWPFAKAGDPLPGDPAIKVSSLIDNVKVDMTFDPAEAKRKISFPEAD